MISSLPEGEKDSVSAITLNKCLRSPESLCNLCCQNSKILVNPFLLLDLSILPDKKRSPEELYSRVISQQTPPNQICQNGRSIIIETVGKPCKKCTECVSGLFCASCDGWIYCTTLEASIRRDNTRCTPPAVTRIQATRMSNLLYLRTLREITER